MIPCQISYCPSNFSSRDCTEEYFHLGGSCMFLTVPGRGEGSEIDRGEGYLEMRALPKNNSPISWQDSLVEKIRANDGTTLQE